jgi:phosphoglycerol transferase MdoB-like AlkP superfamily enzyme
MMNPSARGGRAAAAVAALRALGALSPSTWRLVALPLGVLTLQGVLLELVQFEMLVRRETQTLGVADTDLPLALLAQHAAPLVLPILVGVLVALRLPAGVPPARRVLAAGMAGALLLAGLSIVLPEPPAWLSFDFVHALRADLAFVCLLAAAFLLLLEHTRGAVRAAGVVGLHLTSLVLMVLGSLEFGYFVVTGSLADAFLLRYALTHAGDVSWVLGSTLRRSNLLFLLVPLAVPALALSTGRRARRRPEAARAGRAPGLGWILVAGLLLAAVPGTPSGAAVQLGGSTYLALATDLMRTPAWEGRVAGGEELETALFDTRALRFAATDRTRPLNVVVVVLESQRSRTRLPAGVTPFLDTLAARALVVDEMYAIVPHTNRALVPILCGIYPRITQGYAADVPGACLPALLRPHGYASAFFTTATLAFERKGELLTAMGYDEVRGAEDIGRTRFEKVNYFGYEDEAALEPMLAWAERQHRAERPFLLTTLTLTPHHPYGVPRSFPRRSFAPDHRALDDYLNALAYVDAFVARLFAGFGARGLTESTLFVLVGDHGEAFGEHGLQFHSAVVWDEGLHVPALLLSPRLLPAPRRVGGPRMHTDLLPTIADLLGFAVEGGVLSGTSLLAPVRDDRTLHHATWIDNQSMALRRGAKKYVYHYRRLPLEVYDLGRDPLERVNLLRELAPGEAEAVELELLRWRRRVNERYG